jgi:hypothetical protein
MPRSTSAKSPFADFPAKDSDWTDAHWRHLINWFMDSGILTARELASLMLGHLNPSQVGTSIASKETFQAHFPPRKIMQAVMALPQKCLLPQYSVACLKIRLIRQP